MALQKLYRLKLSESTVEGLTKTGAMAYQAIGEVDADLIHAAVSQMSARSTDRLAATIPRLYRERFLSNDLDDGKLCIRLILVMRRVTLPQLPGAFQEMVPAARRLIALRTVELLRELAVAKSARGKQLS